MLALHMAHVAGQLLCSRQLLAGRRAIPHGVLTVAAASYSPAGGAGLLTGGAGAAGGVCGAAAGAAHVAH